MPLPVISIYTREICGVRRIYVADETLAKHITQLTGAKTLEHRHIDAMESLGFTFEQVLPPKKQSN